MSTKPRTPQYFPRMKVRGARRRHLAPWQRTAGAITRMGDALAMAASQMVAFHAINIAAAREDEAAREEVMSR